MSWPLATSPRRGEDLHQLNTWLITPATSEPMWSERPQQSESSSDRCAMVELGMGASGEGRGGRSVDAGGGGRGADVGLRVELSNRFTYKAGANVAKAVTFTRAGDGEVDTEVADIVVSSPG